MPATPRLKETAYRFRRVVIFLFQVCLTILAGLIAFMFRFDFDFSRPGFTSVFGFLIVALAIKIPIYQAFNLNRGWWRYSSLSDMLTIFKAITLAQVIILLTTVVPYFPRFSHGAMMIDYFLTLLAMGGARLFIRAFYEKSFRSPYSRRRSDKRVVIVGAGMAGIGLLRQIRNTESLRVDVVGFLDDSTKKHGMSFYGIPVLGFISTLPRVIASQNVTDVYIAVPSMSKTEMKKVVDLCLKSRTPFKTIPSLSEIIELKSKFYQLREVKVEDLLGREPIRLDKSKTLEEVSGKVVIVTGAGGSIGSELCRQILTFTPRKLILFERGEENLFYIERELRAKFPATKIVAVIGDILDEVALEETFAKYSPSLVYHAAAYKHVPLMETNVREAVRNNVLGTRNVADVSIRHGAKKFVMISTDKAVNPINAMGYSKRFAELVVQSRAGHRTEMISVRFGNVLGSSGSAVEIFRKQLAAGQPLTVTEPDATRFFMTTPEAVELVLHASSHGSSGEIYMLDMGTPVRIGDLADKMIQLADPEGIRNFKVEVIGLRAGEKMSEEIVWEGEDFSPSEVEKVFILRNKVLVSNVHKKLDRVENCIRHTGADMFHELKTAVDSLDNTVRDQPERGFASTESFLEEDLERPASSAQVS